MQQQEGRLVAIHEMHGLGADPLVDVAKHALLDASIQRGIEFVGPGQADDAGQVGGAQTPGLQVTPVRANERGHVRTRRVAHQEQARRITAERGGVLTRPRGGGRCVLDECREAVARRLPVIRHDDEHAARGQCMAHEPVVLAAPALPASTVQEHHHRRRPARPQGRVDVEGQVTLGVVEFGARFHVARRRVDRLEISLLAAGEGEHRQGGQRETLAESWQAEPHGQMMRPPSRSWCEGLHKQLPAV